MAPAEDQYVVEALSSDGADPTLRERVGPWCPDRSLHDPEALGPEDFVERSRELGVSIPEQDVLVLSSWVIERFRACWVTQAESGRLVVPATRTRLVESSMKNSTYSVFSNTVSTVKKSQASAPPPCARRNSLHVGPVRRGACPRPARRRIRRIVVAPTTIASFRSSPWILTQPHLGFSLPRRRMSSVTSGSSGGRPGVPPPVRPLASDELSVPPQQRLGRDHERGPSLPGEGSARPARNARSPSCSSWRRTERRRTFTWWRRTAFSSWSWDALPRPVSAPITRTSTK